MDKISTAERYNLFTNLTFRFSFWGFRLPDTIYRGFLSLNLLAQPYFWQFLNCPCKPPPLWNSAYAYERRASVRGWGIPMLNSPFNWNIGDGLLQQ